MAEKIVRFVCNTAGKTRKEKLEGKEYVVANAAMLAEGVWAGSKGPVFYSNPELAKTASVWNMKPIVLDHPTINGLGVTACDPEIVASRKMGLLFNTKHNDKLRTEAWFDVEKTKELCPDVLNALEKGEKVEISTGLFADVEVSPGIFNKKKYDYVAKNLRPDHLAVLPGKLGAYSVEDGGGLLANSSQEEESLLGPIKTQEDLDTAIQLIGNGTGAKADELRAKLKLIASTKGFTLTELVINKEVKTEVKDLFTKDEYVLLQNKFMANASEDKMSLHVTNKDGTTTLVNNAVSQRDISKGINEAMYMENKKQGYWPGYLEDVYPNFFIYQERDKYYKRDYAVDSQYNVSVANNAEPVKKHQEYQTMQGRHIAVKDRDMTGSYVIRNEKIDPQPKPGVTPIMSEKKEQTMAEFIENTPPQYRGALSGMFMMHENEKRRLVGIIVKHPRNVFKEVDLFNKELPELQGLAALVEDTSKPAPGQQLVQNYYGAGGMVPIVPEVRPTQKPLGLPVHNFRKKEEAAAK